MELIGLLAMKHCLGLLPKLRFQRRRDAASSHSQRLSAYGDFAKTDAGDSPWLAQGSVRFREPRSFGDGDTLNLHGAFQ